ncbi:multidrug resistance protein [Thermosporothrix hazakensis]|jgi:multidrug resistance protein|uniref:Multidrug resistance protein n=2 Tax=Thermosporothrix TaxID=768650 RepID=A0A326UFC1_THEHA|nr:MFS transporter [Thermosporothrix hazakensis]PZW36605.1 multidrug resistance protein [Thermosporothrix hazakensis]BBH89073.1 tetracycline resistance MFS efflux pump [Thermosporothrix sp. COM3]GCE47256.1 tetracycline resistance MFS efflux pump [Thermosporothrix hazakensis]
MEKQKRTAISLMALTVLIDFTGFGLIIPLLPFWAEHFGANAFMVGMLSSLYALAQFLFTPLLGSLSDRYGRKPIILLSLVIEALSFALTALAGSLPVLLLARFIGGLGASNIGSAQAVVADVTAPKERARGMGIIGASIGLGFVVGPALGGVLAQQNQTLPFWIAAGVALLNMVLVLFLLPETRKRSSVKEEAQQRGINVLFSGWRTAVHYPLILSVVLVNLLYTVAFTGMESVFALFTQHEFGWGASQNAYVFTYIGVIVVIMQGGLVGQLVRRWRENVVMIGGMVCLALGLLVLAFSHQLALLLIALGILSIGDGAVSPLVSTLLSFATPSDVQGETQGFAQGIAGLGRVLGPLVAGGLYALGGPAIPFVVGGLLSLLAVLTASPSLAKIQRPA